MTRTTHEPARPRAPRAALALLVALTALTALTTLTAACASTADLPRGADDLDTARMWLEMGRFEESADLARPLARDTDESPQVRAEAAFVAGEAEFADGKHAKALQHYRYILENAPWSPHADLIRDRLFEIGEIFFHDERYDGWFGGRGRGVEALEAFQAWFRNDDRADDALRLVADYFETEREYEEAAFTYERLIETYPESEWVERSLWRAGWCRLQIAQGPEYDRDELLRAQEKLRTSLRTFPRGVAAQEAAADLARVRDQLARSELVVADFYRSRGKWEGERLRLANAWLLYPETQAGALARDRLAAANVDLEALETDAGLSSVDSVKPGKQPWSQR